MGTSVYLLFTLTFLNFILIAYRYLLENDPILEEVIPSLWIFGVIFLITYLPVSILIGFWHRKTQLSVENTIQQKEGPFFSKMMRVLLDAQTGKASDEEIEKFRNFLKNIEKELDEEIT
jgi:hypothetical protein|tara:strand:- start:112 stop:468 length:357 start_codon:yes stop_codon:yes gene_type:complete